MQVMRIIRDFGICVFATVCFLLFYSFSWAAPAAVGVPDEASVLDILRPVYDAIHGGHYAYAAALGLIALVALIKRYTGNSIPWFHTNTGGSFLALLMASATALAAGLATPDAHLTLTLFRNALLVGVGAAGGYAMIKNLIIVPLLPHLPGWARVALTPVLWIFDSSSKPTQVKIEEAVTAGNVAVEATPAGGMTTITGKPVDIS